jgi:hypothetical protein
LPPSRNEALQHGLELPEDVRQHILTLRLRLRDAGLSDEQINATPGLELPGGADERCVRCGNPASAEEDCSLAAQEWEVFGQGWLCPECITPAERQAIDEADMDLHEQTESHK